MTVNHQAIIKDQGDLILRLCEGYRRLLVDTNELRLKVDAETQVELDRLKEIMDRYYPGRAGQLFLDTYGSR